MIWICPGIGLFKVKFYKDYSSFSFLYYSSDYNDSVKTDSLVYNSFILSSFSWRLAWSNFRSGVFDFGVERNWSLTYNKSRFELLILSYSLSSMIFSLNVNTFYFNYNISTSYICEHFLLLKSFSNPAVRDRSAWVFCSPVFKLGIMDWAWV